MKNIPFNKPFLIGNEIEYIKEAISTGKISGDGLFTKKASDYFITKFGFKKPLLTSSCTDALEMAAILCNISPGDEVILPSYTFVSTANAFALRGADLVFADSLNDLPNIDPEEISRLVTPKTRAVVVVHYGGIACRMDEIKQITDRYGLYLIEDAAQAIDSYYKNKPLGSIGDLAAFSFHETKNVISGEGGMLNVNRDEMINRAEIIREKGTNRAAFFRGEIDKYNWVDIGSSFLPSEITAAFLFAQLENLELIQAKRIKLWEKYYTLLSGLENAGFISLLKIPDYAVKNGHLFCILCRSLGERTALAAFLKQNGILAVFHYLSLHKSPFYNSRYSGKELVNSDRYSDTLLRLPLYYELTEDDVEFITDKIKEFYNKI
ncbi:MAG: pyridoxal phosphate-dependent cell wall biosynthesis enzyme [Chlorobi bacterium OLB5]|nr:MAG: pyridoxal phosphate-dependent cell wall biosynthesis enzyme [Chlorobi bacterium OLB5]